MDRRTYLAAGGAGVSSLLGAVLLTNPARLSPLLREGVQGRGEPVAAEETVTDDSVAYLERTDEVRYVTARGGEGPLEHETEPFERWAERECASVGLPAVVPTVEDRLGTDFEHTSGLEGEWYGLVIELGYPSYEAAERRRSAHGGVGFDELVDAAPRTVRATVRLEGKTHTRDVPVLVQRIRAPAGWV